MPCRGSRPQIESFEQISLDLDKTMSWLMDNEGIHSTVRCVPCDRKMSLIRDNEKVDGKVW